MNPRWSVIVKAGALACAGLLTVFFVMEASSAGAAGALRASGGSEQAPVISLVSPATIPNDLDTPLTITGAGFTRELSGTELTLPTVALNGAALAAVGWLSSTELTATVPWGLDPGAYPLTVTNPDGQSGSLAGAITVTQGLGVWTSGGPYGGPVFTLLLHPANKTTLYALAAGSGLFRSQDRGSHWELVLTGSGGQAHAAALSLPAGTTLYAQKFGLGVLRSEDGGDTWSTLPFPNPACSDLRVFPSPHAAQTVFVTASCAFSGGLYKSLDRGDHWISVTAGLTDTHTTALGFDPNDPQVLYTGTQSGNVFRSEDGGASWAPYGQPDLFISELAVNPFGNREVWAAGADGSGHWGYLWKHTGGGWVQVQPGAGGENQVNALQFSPTISGTLWVGTFQGALKTPDGGLAWGPAGGPARHVTQLAIDFSNPQDFYLGFNGQGVARTDDSGATWEYANQGLAGVIPNGLALHPDDPATVYATAHGVGTFKTNNGGGSWVELPTNNLIPRAPVVDPTDPRRVYTGEGGALVISADAGASWHKVLLDPPPAYADCCSLQVLALLALEQPGRLLLGAGFQEKNAASYGYVAGGLYSSSDYGESWTYIDVGQALAPVTVLAQDPGDPATVYAGAGALGVVPGAGIWKSENRGAAWSPSGLTGQEITGLAVDPDDPQRVYATNREKFYASPDGGATWELRGPQEIGLEKLLFTPTTPPALYRYGWQGLARSQDGGLTWARAAGALGNANVSAMVTVLAEGRAILYTGSGGGSAATTSLTSPARVPAAETLVSAGVYRNTLRLESPRVYLPLVRK